MTINISFDNLKLITVNQIAVYTVHGGSVKEVVFFTNIQGGPQVSPLYELSDAVTEVDFKAHFTSGGIVKVEAISN